MIDLDNMKQGERLELLSTLLKQTVGAVAVDMPPYEFACPLIIEDVPPGECKTGTMYPQQLVKLKKLIINETSSVRRTFDETTEYNWFGKRKRSTHVEHKQDIIVPRSNWALSNAFVGNRPVFPQYGNIHGDLFSPEGELGFGNIVCQPALALTLTVKNLGTERATFWCAVLGIGEKHNFRAASIESKSVEDVK